MIERFSLVSISTVLVLLFKTNMKLLLLCLILLSAQFSYSNESSTQWFIQPLKIKHQVGKDQMTEAALYRFPVFMYYTHMTGTVNNITAANKLEKLTLVKDVGVLKDVNLASLYGIDVFYEIKEDITRIDLTKAKKPDGEPFSLDDVIAMTLECVRLTGVHKNTIILTDDRTEKWKSIEKGLQDGTIEEPIYTIKTVPLNVSDGDLLYHWAYWPGSITEEQSEPTRFPTHGGKQESADGSHTSYQGIGLSFPLSMLFPNTDETRDLELNSLAGYKFEKQNGFIVIQAPALPQQKEEKKDAYALMKQAVECLILSTKANDEKDLYRIKISDPRLSKEQCEELISMFSLEE